LISRIKPFQAVVAFASFAANITAFFYSLVSGSSFNGWLSLMVIILSTYALSRRY
jgi:hypothetical protein